MVKTFDESVPDYSKNAPMSSPLAAKRMDNLPLTAFAHVPPDAKSVTIIVTDQFDPTQQLAFLRPFRMGAALRRHGVVFLAQHDLIRIFTFSGKKHYYDALRRCVDGLNINSLIFSRYTGSYWEDILDICADYSIPTAVFLDDNLLEVPMEIGESAYHMYHQEHRATALRETLAEVDLVIASTKALSNQLSIYAHKKLTYTKIYCSTGPSEIRQIKFRQKPKKIGYMASIWHKHDLEFIYDQIFDVLKEHPDIEFQVFGFEFHPGKGVRLPKCFKPVSASYAAFRTFHDSLGWDIGLAPLRPLGYNRCKANTKWVEYSCAGSAVVAANMDPYWDLDRGAVSLSTANEWGENLARLIEDADFRHRQQSAAQRLLLEEFSFDKHALQFCTIMKSIGTEF